MDRPSSSVARLVALGFVALGCTAEVVDDPAQAQGESTHALVTIARSAPALAPEEARADAFAGFFRTTRKLDATSAFRVAGLAVELPALGECRAAPHGGSVTAPELSRIELLDAGEVTLATGTTVTTLALRAFPTVTESISGVVYTTRDRASAPLPANSAYTVATTGGSVLGPLSAEAAAPATLSDVAIGGVPLAELSALRAGSPLELAWAPGAAGDRVYVELEWDSSSTLCAFRDDAGRGSIAAEFLPDAAEASLSLHRLRQAAFGAEEISRGELRFDFELSASIDFE